MDPIQETLSYLKAKGYKTTRVRTLVIELLANSKSPISVTEILQKFTLRPNELTVPNKTTIYRELDFLLEQGIIREIDFSESKKRYEFKDAKHHHHIICVKCKKIEDVDLNQDLKAQETKITKEKNFKIINHSLEFFGLCSICQ